MASQRQRRDRCHNPHNPELHVHCAAGHEAIPLSKFLLVAGEQVATCHCGVTIVYTPRHLLIVEVGNVKVTVEYGDDDDVPDVSLKIDQPDTPEGAAETETGEL